MKRLIYYALMCLVANVILFVTCALPWYGVIAVSGWYALMAFPFTLIGAYAVKWIMDDAEEVLNRLHDMD